MTSFEELGLDAKLLKAIQALGFTEPTPIQSQAIPVLLSGTRDLVGLAQTGTGKTAMKVPSFVGLHFIWPSQRTHVKIQRVPTITGPM